MSVLSQLNSAPLYLICGLVILFVMAMSVFFLVRAWRAGLAMGLEKAKLGRAVTSKTTLTGGEPELLKKIKMVAAVDLIRYYAMTTVEDEYLGKCANSYDNKCVLLSAFADFFATLEARGVLRSGSGGAELDAEAIRAYLLDQEPGA